MLLLSDAKDPSIQVCLLSDRPNRLDCIGNRCGRPQRPTAMLALRASGVLSNLPGQESIAPRPVSQFLRLCIITRELTPAGSGRYGIRDYFAFIARKFHKIHIHPTCLSCGPISSFLQSSDCRLTAHRFSRSEDCVRVLHLRRVASAECRWRIPSHSSTK